MSTSSWLRTSRMDMRAEATQAYNAAASPSMSEDTIRMILNDDEQWQKLQLAMRKSGLRTSMRLSQNLEELIQERVDDMSTAGQQQQQEDGNASLSSLKSPGLSPLTLRNKLPNDGSYNNSFSSFNNVKSPLQSPSPLRRKSNKRVNRVSIHAINFQAL